MPLALDRLVDGSDGSSGSNMERGASEDEKLFNGHGGLGRWMFDGRSRMVRGGLSGAWRSGDVVMMETPGPADTKAEALLAHEGGAAILDFGSRA